MSGGGVVVLLAVALPLVSATLFLLRRSPPALVLLAPLSALPALGIGLGLLPAGEARLDGVLLGLRLDGSDDPARVFLLFTGALWLAAGPLLLAAPPRPSRVLRPRPPSRNRLLSWWTAALAGMIGIAIARDLVGFYVFYALLTYSLYGLVVHRGDEGAARAGRLYLALGVAGELLLLAALLLVAAESPQTNPTIDTVPALIAASPRLGWILALLLAGLGVKSALVPLHVWVPLAYSAAPPATGAVIAGATIHAGLLGWLRFLPLGEASLPGWGVACAVIGVVGIFYSFVAGIGQSDPKVVLGYSSVGQIGFVTAALGAALTVPGHDAEPALLYFALHHAMAKGALFLGLAVLGTGDAAEGPATDAGDRPDAAGAGGPAGSRPPSPRFVGSPAPSGAAAAEGPARDAGDRPDGAAGRPAGWILGAALLFPALELAGAPLSSGAVAKSALEHTVELAPWGRGALPTLLSLGTVGSALLTLRFLALALTQVGRHAPSPRLWVPWALLLVFDVGLLFRPPVQAEALGTLLEPEKLVHGLWPILVALGLAGAAWLAGRRGWALPAIPPGDLIALAPSARVVKRAYTSVIDVGQEGRNGLHAALLAARRPAMGLLAMVEHGETGLRGASAAGLALALVFGVLLLLLLL